MKLFHKRRQEDDSAPGAPGKARRYVPASLVPRPSRDTLSLEVADDAEDSDLAFLQALLLEDEDDGDAPEPPPAAARRGHVEAAPEHDDLEPFRERRIERDERVHERSRHIADVPMAHLVDELETVAAALRRRKAA
jgi:hypothetical protein